MHQRVKCRMVKKPKRSWPSLFRASVWESLSTMKIVMAVASVIYYVPMAYLYRYYIKFLSTLSHSATLYHTELSSYSHLKPGIDAQERVCLALLGLRPTPRARKSECHAVLASSSTCIFLWDFFILNLYAILLVGKRGSRKAGRVMGVVEPWEAMGMEEGQTGRQILTLIPVQTTSKPVRDLKLFEALENVNT